MTTANVPTTTDRLGWARDPKDGRMYVSAEDLAAWLDQKSGQWDSPTPDMLPGHMRGRANRKEAQGFAKGTAAAFAGLAMALRNDATQLDNRPGLIVPGEG